MVHWPWQFCFSIYEISKIFVICMCYYWSFYSSLAITELMDMSFGYFDKSRNFGASGISLWYVFSNSNISSFRVFAFFGAKYSVQHKSYTLYLCIPCAIFIHFSLLFALHLTFSATHKSWKCLSPVLAYSEGILTIYLHTLMLVLAKCATRFTGLNVRTIRVCH